MPDDVAVYAGAEPRVDGLPDDRRSSRFASPEFQGPAFKRSYGLPSGFGRGSAPVILHDFQHRTLVARGRDVPLNCYIPAIVANEFRYPPAFVSDFAFRRNFRSTAV